ncbi:MAG: energy transducer TonB [Bacteroidota bacterium]
MSLRKTEKANLRLRYTRNVQIGMILTLLLLIGAVNARLEAESAFEVQLEEQEVVQMEEIVNTKQEVKPPPPPKPPVPIEVPNDEILDDIELDLDATLDIEEPVTDLPPPPPPADDGPEPEPEPEIFMIVEDMPQLIPNDTEGLANLQRSITYPEIAKKAGVEGRVIVQFVVDEQGNVLDPQVVRGIGAGCDEEAVRAVMNAQFRPGRQRGQPVRVKMSLPITFKLK